MKLSMLLENSKKNNNYRNEHGLSIFIEYEGKKILFDTGPSKTYLANAKKMNIEIKNTETIVISHGHSDHISGLQYFSNNDNLQHVFISQKAFNDFWIKVGPKFLNVSLKKEKLSHLEDKIAYINQTIEVYPNIWIMPLKFNHDPEGNLYMGQKNAKTIDDFHHEIILVIEENNELVIFTGCSHNGIANIMEFITQQFPHKKIKAVIGGFHLIKFPYINNLNTSKQNIQNLAHTLSTYDVETYYSCHCTGNKAFKIMKEILGDRLSDFPTGEVKEI